MTNDQVTETQQRTRAWIAAADDRAWAAHVMETTRSSPRWLVRDLYGPLAEARREAPVQPRSQWDLVGLPEHQHTLSVFAERPVYAAIGFDAVHQAFADGATFSSRIHNDTIGLVWGETMLGFDGPEHRRNRGLISQAFTKPALVRWEHEIVQPVVDGLIDRFSGAGRADLVQEFTMLFPVYVIAEMLGLPRQDVPQFTAWAVDTITIFHDAERGLQASRDLGSYLHDVIEERRGREGHDIISVLARAELEGTRLKTQEIVNFLRLLLPAGAETTYRSSSNLLFALLHDPDTLDRVRRDRDLLAPAMEEGFRWEPPLTSVNRVTTVDAVLDGVAIPAGAIVECSMGGANRDPSRWDAPDRYDIDRPFRTHAAFINGPHTCLGMHLARLETRVAVSSLLDRLPGLALDADDGGEPPEIRGIGFRAPNRLPVRFDA